MIYELYQIDSTIFFDKYNAGFSNNNLYIP